MGCETIFSGTPDYDITKQIASFEQDLVKQPEGHPAAPDATPIPFIEPINRAIDSGVRRSSPSRRTRRTRSAPRYITSDNTCEGKFAAEEIVKRWAARASMRCSRIPARATTTCASRPSSPRWRRTILT